MKRCLLVGIDDYQTFPRLGGCINDALALHPLLARNADVYSTPNFDCVVEAGTTGLTRDRLLQRLDQLFAAGPDCAVFYFAGHGAAENGDVALVTTDGTRTSPGVRFQEILEKINESATKEIIVILDCCFSGGAAHIPLLGAGNSHLRKGLSILTASRDDQVAMENTEGRGQFSAYLEGALDEGAADILGNINVSGVYAYVSELLGGWDQRPTFKANIDRLHNLRTCQPRVHPSIIRDLKTWFTLPRCYLPLDPSYEPTAEPHHPEHEEIFAKLQQLRAARLVEPVGDGRQPETFEHLYYAAMNSKGCRLTALGRHYRQLAAANLI